MDKITQPSQVRFQGELHQELPGKLLSSNMSSALSPFPVNIKTRDESDYTWISSNFKKAETVFSIT